MIFGRVELIVGKILSVVRGGGVEEDARIRSIAISFAISFPEELIGSNQRLHEEEQDLMRYNAD